MTVTRIVSVGMLLASVAPAAQADPQTRAVEDEAALASLNSAPWPDAEDALRVAMSRELARLEADPEADPADWSEALTALETSRMSGDWHRRALRRRLEDALNVGDVETARKAVNDLKLPNGELDAEAWRRIQWLRAQQVAWMFLPWLFALASAGLVGFGLDALASRRAQGGRARTVINPYVTGRPLRDSRLVFGRDTIIRDVRRGLSDGESFYLTGERRIGKTTILLQVGELHRRAGGTSVFVDVAGSFGDQAQVVLQRALVQANRAQGLDDGGDAMTLARRLRERGELALMVDEVDSLNGADVPTRRLFRAMCLEADAPARMVAAGVGLDVQRDEEAQRWGPLIRTIQVGPLPENAARALLTEPVAGALTWTEPATRAVLELASGRPMVIQLYGLHVVDQLGVSGRSRVIASDVQEAKAKVERAWKAIRDEGLEDELVPVDLDTALMELGRLGQEIDDLERIVALERGAT